MRSFGPLSDLGAVFALLVAEVQLEAEVLKQLSGVQIQRTVLRKGTELPTCGRSIGFPILDVRPLHRH